MLLQAIGLELLLVALSFAVLGVTMIAPGRRDGKVEAAIAAAGLAGLFAATFAGLGAEVTAFGGAWGTGPLALLYKRLFLGAGFLTVLMSWPAGQPHPALPRARLGESFGLLILSVSGMCVLASARELAVLYTGLELLTMPAIALVAMHPREPRSAEAGLKYVFTAALSSGLLLYGLSLLYGLTGSTMIVEIAARLPAGPLTIVALAMVAGGAGFKISAVPFHLWAPDTYEGAPVPVTAFLSVASKAAGFVLLAKAVTASFGPSGAPVGFLVAVLATVTMTVGNLVALHQTRLKRFLAWSSIAQAGYILVGVAGDGDRATASVAYYLLVYLVTNLAAFGVVTVVAEATGREDMTEWVGISESNPRLSAVMMLALFSLAGIPPLAGFLGKFYLFASAAGSGLIWLVLVAAVNSTISLYYYLIVLKWMYIVKPDEKNPGVPKIAVPTAAVAGLALATVGMILVGLVPGIVRWAQTAAAAGF